MSNLPELLGEIAGQAKHYDVAERALHGGRRRRVRRRLAVTATAAMTVTSVLFGLMLLPEADKSPNPPAATSPPPSPPNLSLPTGCQRTDLPVPAGYLKGADLQAGDPAGRWYVGQAVDPGPGQRPMLIWDNDAVTAVDGPHADTFFMDVNANGVAVAEGQGRSYVYRDGAFIKLPGESVQAWAINVDEVVVGALHDPPGVFRPIIWRTTDAEADFLPAPTGWQGWAEFIGDDGVIIGRLTTDDPFPRHVAYIWNPDGSHGEAPLSNGYTGSSIDGYRNGWAVGAMTGSGGQSEVRWNLRTGDIDSLPVEGYKVSAQGWVGVEFPAPELYIEPGRRIPLPAKPITDSTVPKLMAMSDDGLTLAGSLNEDGVRHAIRWRCG